MQTRDLDQSHFTSWIRICWMLIRQCPLKSDWYSRKGHKCRRHEHTALSDHWERRPRSQHYKALFYIGGGHKAARVLISREITADPPKCKKKLLTTLFIVFFFLISVQKMVVSINPYKGSSKVYMYLYILINNHFIPESFNTNISQFFLLQYNFCDFTTRKQNFKRWFCVKNSFKRSV